jgi:alkylation response protein AidB-like acyl-CoA dehydrogenase
MDFDFSEDQEQLREAVSRWVAKAYTFERRRAIAHNGGLDRAAFAELAELGLTALSVPEAHGGLGMGAVDVMVVLEQLGRGMVLEPLGQHLVAAGVLNHANAEVQAQWLPRMAAGEALVSLAHQERGNRYRLDKCRTQATQGAHGWQISGAKHLVPGGDRVDGWIVPAQTGQGMALFLVAADAAGVRTTAYPTQDGSRAGDLHLDQAHATLITQQGDDALQEAMDALVACTCAEGVGLMDTTLAITADYLNTRKQFGVPIATFQALRHRVADMKMQLELARSMSYYATLKLGAPAAERSLAMSRAKVQLGQSMRFVGQQAVQLHGGIGVTDEYIVSHCFKKLTQLEMTAGDTLHHLGAVSEGLQDTAGVFA